MAYNQTNFEKESAPYGDRDCESSARECGGFVEWENSYEAHEARWQKEIDTQNEEDEQRHIDALPCWDRTLLTQAENLAGLGFPVFPAKIEEGAKKSYIAGLRNGRARWGATTCPDELFAYWLDHPDALLGMPTGSKAEGGGGFVVLDIDTLEGHGVDGLKNLAEILDRAGRTIEDLPETVRARTPTGGWHLYFKLPEGLPPRKFLARLALGVDIQADKKSIIAPPSYRSDKGASYVWDRSPFDHPMAEAPDWLIELICKPRAEPKAKTLFGHGNKRDARKRPKSAGRANGPDAEAALAFAIDELRQAQPGERNDTLNKSAFKLGAHVATGLLEKEVVAEALRAAALEIGLDPSEIEGTIDSGLTAGIAKARLPDTGKGTKSQPDPDLSDGALARELERDHFRGNARYCVAQARWYVCGGSLWREDGLLEVPTQVRRFLEAKADDLHQEALTGGSDSTGDPSRTNWATARANTLKSKAKISAVEALARTNPGVPVRPEDFDTDRFLLGTPGGVVNLRTGELRPGRREDLITKSTSVTPSEPGNLPHRFLKFLEQIFNGDQEMIGMIQRVGGYALTGSTSEQLLFFLYGTGSNGKSVLLSILRSIWGDYAKDAPKELFFTTRNQEHPTALAGLQGARLAIGSEIARGATWSDAMIKDLTGGERLTARFMRGDYFSFEPQFTLMIAGNAKPALAAVDPAIRRRFKLIPFEVQIPREDRDPDLLDKLKLEAPEILRWFIEGAVLWHSDRLKLPARIADASEAYLDAEDHLKRFLEEETFQDPRARTKLVQLHQTYGSWCVKQGLTSPRKGDFISDMTNHGWEWQRLNGGYTYTGLGLKNP